MDQQGVPPPAPAENEVKYDTNNNEEEEEGEPFDFDSGDEVPEADRQAPSAPMERGAEAGDGDIGEATLPAGGGNGMGTETTVETTAVAEPAKLLVPTKVNPYSVIDITPFQEDQPPSPDTNMEEEGVSLRVPSGYSVPVPCGYAVPSNLPLLLPAYSSPVIIRAESVEEEETPEVVEDGPLNSLSSEDPPPSGDQSNREGSALARWAADPANTAWMENPEEAIYDDVPRENSDSEPDEMIYDDVENGDEGGNSSLEYGWSSSEFESYEEQSDSECKNGIPRSFLRGSHKKQLSHDLTRLKAHCEEKMRGLVASTVGAVEVQQAKHRQERKMQKLMKAAKEGTKDGLEKTKAAVKRGRSFIRTKSFISQDHRSCFEEEQNLFIDVDCKHPEAVLTPMPEGLSQQQVVRRYILGSIVESEKNYVDALKRILEQYEKPLSEMEPRLLSERKLRMVFYRIKEILQCHSLFQIALASRVSEWDTVETIGDVFVASFSKSMVLDAYSEYVNNFSTAVAVLKKTCATKPAFLDFLKQSQESSPDRVTLHSLMMRPIQRFPQFILLLQDMLKNTARGHPDRLPLQMALTELETLAEKLNERKRDADQRCEIKQIAKAINERYLNKLLSSGNRYLIRSDDVIETVYNDKGEIIKTKERRLFMLNDVLMCATASPRASHESHVVTSQRYLLKWSVPLGHVDVIEYGSSPGAGEHGRHPTTHSPESLAVVANVKPYKVYMGPGQLYQDLQNLLHDLNVVGQIAQLIGNLRGNYQNLNQSVAHEWTSGLQRLILKKEEEIRAADRCRIQLQLPGKQDKSGRPTFFSAVFNTFTPAIKESWVSSLQMAKLALEEENHLGWFCVDDDGNQAKKEMHPLLVGHMPVMVARQPEFKIECAAYNPEPYLSNESQPDSLSTARGFLWIGSCSSQMGQIAIVSFQSSNPKVIECFNVESRILCMAYIPAEEQQPREPSGAIDAEAAVVRASHVPTICLGTEEGSISIYKSSQGSKKVRLQHFFTPDKSTVMSLACSPQGLYAGLVNGSVASYTKAPDGSWNSEPQQVIKLGVLPVRSLLLVDGSLWAASGGQVFVANLETHTIENQLEAHQDEGMVISHMAVAGVGIWIAFTSGSTLRLFHTETLKHLQDVNIAAPVHGMLPGHQRLSVTSLLVCHGLLMVGTSLGVVVALPVPRLQGIPKVTGRGMVSYHAHNGPVRFIVMATALQKSDKDRARESPPPGPESQDEDPKDALSGEGGTSCPSQGDSNTAVWLGDSLGLTAQKSDLSSSSGSLNMSHGSSSLEHRSVDSSLCDLLKDPSASSRSRAQRCRRAKASSALVVCGGQGHRRVHRKARQPPQEDLVSSVMVWQIPLLSS
uniref:rho guanine nucleotide exchange factor 10 isoform X1 n=1 Tax=Jaculus jaculus TaxID=51337 RepID=UPI000333110F|nr:rho guanine nucleotide exchange factor 10 isoform X1 [Jaculus jaculus]XP_044986671.1 rho guanine nucleotide exchange factor 10 isoform X1 [Jaculus jaculus]XP_044986672.1 rho guanine nucleotide exchange factor 10 isoform X1 [Jaculus jaculus]XP_044986673.1 rho guanine nucleotide exchange factor 10 isoform X1 [Jaculus jaculus]XP_044986674.1 rho guanine nucleotide exchange factor 10 isoform X1 [Jaculus jaculus]